MTKGRNEDALPPMIEDALHAMGRAGSSIVPGGSLVFDLVFRRPWEARTDEKIQWCQRKLDQLYRRGLLRDGLSEDPEFIDAVASILRSMGMTSKNEKLKALQNAFVNAATEKECRPATSMLVGIIDRVDSVHLLVLRFLHDPRLVCGDKWTEVKKTLIAEEVLRRQLESLDDDMDLARSVMEQLSALGLVRSEHRTFDSGFAFRGHPSQLLTGLGRQLLDLISRRDDDEPTTDTRAKE